MRRLTADHPATPPLRTLRQRAVAGLLHLPLVRWSWRRGLKALFGLQMSGLENVPACRPLLFVSNHGSHFDGLFLRFITGEVLGTPAVPVVWGGVRRFPAAQAAIEGRAFHVILTRESAPTSESRASVLDQIIEHLREGRSVVLNPEGARHDTLGTFQPGAAYAALQTGALIVPITLRGVQPLWKTLPWPQRWHGHVNAHFHAAVDPADYASQPWSEAVAGMTADARARIASALDYPDSESGAG